MPADERIRTRITLVDREMEAQKDYFKAQFPYIESQIDDIEVEYCHDDICRTAMRTRLQQWAQNKHCMLTVTGFTPQNVKPDICSDRSVPCMLYKETTGTISVLYLLFSSGSPPEACF